MSKAAVRSFWNPPRFDPQAGVVIRSPLKDEPGYWVGAPGSLYDPDSRRFFLVYRVRRPRGVHPDRGAELHIVSGTNGLEFDTPVYKLDKGALGSPSIERCALARLDNGQWALYVSYVDGQDQRWRIDVMLADDPSGFEPTERKPVLLAGPLGIEGVKDPFVCRVAGVWHMIVSFATAVEECDETALHATADAYNTGLIRSATGLAVSADGVNWEWLGEIFGPRPVGWDRYCSRISTLWYDGGLWWAFYDGSASVEENYEEKLGLAYSFDLCRFRRVSASAPWIVLPHATGSVRYVDVLDAGAAGRFLYYESVRPDGSHELRGQRWNHEDG